MKAPEPLVIKVTYLVCRVCKTKFSDFGIPTTAVCTCTGPVADPHPPESMARVELEGRL